MYEISNNVIKMVRGDTLIAKVHALRNGEEYNPVKGDKIRFAMKHKKFNSDRTEYADETPLILKDIPIKTMLLKLNPEDTKNIGFDTYVYDVEITFADGFVDTFIKNAKITLLPEVH